MTQDEKEKLAENIINAAFAETVLTGTSYVKISIDGIENIPKEEIYTAMSDAAREELIDTAYREMIRALTTEDSNKHWAEMCFHIRLRSPEQIFHMEMERRLSKRMAPLFTYEAPSTCEYVATHRDNETCPKCGHLKIGENNYD